jgi:hypothetical protein
MACGATSKRACGQAQARGHVAHGIASATARAETRGHKPFLYGHSPFDGQVVDLQILARGRVQNAVAVRSGKLGDAL